MAQREFGPVNVPLTDSTQLGGQVDGFRLFAIGRWRRHSRTPELTPVFCWLCPRGLGFFLRNDKARSEPSGRAVGVSSAPLEFRELPPRRMSPLDVYQGLTRHLTPVGRRL